MDDAGRSLTPFYRIPGCSDVKILGRSALTVLTIKLFIYT